MVLLATSTTGRQWLWVVFGSWDATRGQINHVCTWGSFVYRYVNHQIRLRRNWGQTVPSQRIPGSQTKEKEFQVRLNILLLLNQLTIKSGFRKAYVWTIWSRQDSQRKSVKVHCFHYSADGLHQLKSCPLCIIPLDRGEKAIRLHALLIANETAIKTTSNQILKWSGLCLKSARRSTLL